MKLSSKMVLIYGTFAGAACIISLLALQVSLNIYDEKLYEKSLQELDFFTRKVNESLEDIDKLGKETALDDDIQEILSGMQDMQYLSAEYSVQAAILRGKVQAKLYGCPEVKNIIYTDGRSETFTVGEYTGELPEDEKKELLSRAHDAAGGGVTENPVKRYPYLVSGRDIRETENATLDYMGSLLITSDIAEIIREESKQLETGHSSLYVYSPEGVVYKDEAFAIQNMPKLSADRGFRIIRVNGKKYFMCYLRSADTGWMYVNTFSYSKIFGQTVEVRYMLLFGFVLLFAGLFAALRKVAGIITRPLNQLTESMKVVETGDFDAAKGMLNQDIAGDETGLLEQEFAVMLDKIDMLIHDNYEKQILLQDTKYKMLQAQINPHFLYNTLNALNWMIKGQKNEDAGIMIVELGKLLRSAFAKNPYTTVSDELDTARGYMTIQQYRYKSRAEFRIEADEDLDTYLIPRMILQPLIENAVYYGVDASLNKCIITVTVSENTDSILLTVKDTGPGMNEEELQQVRAGTIRPQGHGIGLKNIRERLAMTYENNSSTFEIDSVPGEGTVIRISIPKVRTEREHA
jgi:two-component system sensor histidine kinase YesM